VQVQCLSRGIYIYVNFIHYLILAPHSVLVVGQTEDVPRTLVSPPPPILLSPRPPEFSEPVELSLQVIGYIGVGISLIAMAVTIVTLVLMK